MTTTYDASGMLEEALQRASDLQVFPKVAMDVLELSRDESASVRDLGKVVSQDAILTARMLKFANSPVFGRGGRVRELSRAVQLIGFRTTREVALAMALAAAGQPERPGREKLWRHTLQTAFVARVLADCIEPIEGSDAFTAGLLHDIGLSILLELDEVGVLALDATMSEISPRRLDAEVAAFGFDHAQLSEACLRAWKLPNVVCEGVSLHHADVEDHLGSGGGKGLAAVLKLANEVSATGKADVDEILALLEDDEVPERLGVMPNRLRSMLNRAMEQLRAFG